MPVLKEMDPSGSQEQILKKIEKKNNLITNFFKSPPSNKNENQASEKDAAENVTSSNLDKPDTESKTQIANKGGTDAENDLNNSLCDFETSSQPVKPLSHFIKQKTKRQKKDKEKSKSKRKKSKRIDTGDTQVNKDDSIELPYDDFLKLNLDEKSASCEKQDEKGQDFQGRQGAKNGSGDGNLVNLNDSHEISYEDFLKSGCVEKIDVIDSAEEPESKCTDRKTNENIHDDSVVVLDNNSEDSEDKNSEDSENKNSTDKREKAEKPTEKTGKASFFTILPSRQFAQKEDGQKVPVVITVNVPDSPIDKAKPSKSFSIFDKSKAKSGFERCTEKGDRSTIASTEKEDSENEPSTGKIKTRRKLKTGPKSGLPTKATDDDLQIEEEGVNELDVKEPESIKENENDTEQKRKLTAKKMASLDQVVAKPTGKAMQSTLCFSQGGLTAIKSPPPSSDTKEKGKEKENCSNIATKSRATRGKVKKESNSKVDMEKREPRKQRQKKTRTIHSDSDDFEAEIMETPKQRRARKRTCTENSSDKDIEVLEVEENKGRRRRRSKRIYSAEILESPVPMKRAPIKLRLTRVLRSSNDKEGSKSLKVSKAQQLLQRAKTGKKKKASSPSKNGKGKKTVAKKTEPKKGQKSQTSNKIASPTLRRSARNCSRAATEAIAECVEKPEKKLQRKVDECVEEMLVGKKVTSKHPDKTPSKPKKKGKLAPIFMKKSNDPIIVESDEEIPPEKVVDPEKLKAQRNFLLSGVPEKLKKSRAVAAALYGDYPPIPEINHIQQIPSDMSETELNPWKLPFPEFKLGLKEQIPFTAAEKHSKLSSGSITDRNQVCESRVKFNKGPVNVDEFQEDLVRYLLGEISLHNSQYPVRRMYKQLKKKRNQNDILKSENTQSRQDRNEENSKQLDPASDNTKRRSRKRKLEDEMNDTVDAEAGEKKKPLRRNKRRKGTYGASEDCVVIDDQETEDKKKGNQKEVGRKTNVSDCKIDDAEVKVNEPADSISNSDGDTLWADKYQPTCAADILGNTKQVKKMWTWLKEWKHRTDMEMKRLKKQLMKDARSGKISKEEAKKKLGGDYWGEDDSDFDLDDCGSESDCSEHEDDDTLCNTMLLVGPHGVGKTATVSALATELGYKVFEVNASSKRNGKHILAQLQEATQSHQVCKGNLDAMYTTFASLAKKDSCDKPEVKTEKKAPAAFANFFKKSNQTGIKGAGTKVDKSQGNEMPKKKAKRSKENDPSITKEEKPKKLPLKSSQKDMLIAQSTAVDSPSKRKGLNLSSTSLILFEEVDVVFEEDKGFWAAIQTFISTTKRPIILTTSDGSVTDVVEGKHEITTLKLPTSENIASHLQTLCLAENIRTDYHDLLSVVNFCDGDVRKSINIVQFWANSGAGTVQEKRPIKYSAKFMNKTEEESQLTVATPQPLPASTPIKHRSIIEQLNTSIDSEDEFVSIPRGRRRKRAAIVSDDESSRDSFPCSPVRNRRDLATVAEEAEDSQGSQESLTLEVTEEDKTDTLTATEVVAPVVYTGCLDNVVLCKSHSSVLLKKLKEFGSDTCSVEQLTCHLKIVGSDAVYNHLPFLLHLPRVTQSHKPNNVDTVLSGLAFGWKPKTLKRIKRPASDLFYSDCSSDEESNKSNKIQETENEHSTEVAVKPKREKDHGANIMINSLSALSEMYDTLSFSDTYLSEPGDSKEGNCSRHIQERWCSGKLTAGMSDEKSHHDERNWWKHHYSDDISLEVNCRNLNTTNTRLRKCVKDLADLPGDCLNDVKDRLTIPVPKDNLDQIMAKSETSLQSSQRNSRVRAAGYVADCLPGHVQSQHAALTQDYFPAIRLICKSEQLRQATNTKRRFLHYFDAISFGVTRKQSVVDVLCSSFL